MSLSPGLQQHLQDLPTFLQHALSLGPTIAVADANHPALADVPGIPPDHAVVLRWLTRAKLPPIPTSTPTPASDDNPENTGFPYAYRVGDTACEALIPWGALLAVHGPLAANQRGTVLRPADLPRWLGPATQRAAVLQEVVSIITGRANKPWPFWLPDPNHKIAPALLRPDKAAALRELLADPEAQPKLFIHRTSPGLRADLPPTITGAFAELPVHRRAPFSDLDIGGMQVRWQMAQPGDIVRHFRVPWPAVLAMQDMRTGQGWFWPRDMPKAQFAELHIAQLEQRVDWPGLPLRKPQDLQADAVQQVCFLSPPPERDKRKALARANLLGGAVLLIDRHAEGLRLPGEWGDAAVVAVPLRFPNLEQKTQISGVHVRTHFPDHSARIWQLQIPWSAVFAVGSAGPTGVVDTWPGDFPPVIRAAMRDAAATPAEALVETLPPEAQGSEGHGLFFIPMVGQRVAMRVGRPLGPHSFVMDFPLPMSTLPE